MTLTDHISATQKFLGMALTDYFKNILFNSTFKCVAHKKDTLSHIIALINEYFSVSHIIM